MRIVHIIFSLNTGGAETMLVDIINEQVKSAEITLIIINNQINLLLLNKIDKAVKIRLLGRNEGSHNPYYFLLVNILLWKLNPDVIHSHSISAIRMLLIRKNIVLTIHRTGVPIKNLNKYNKIFAISKSVKNDIEKRSNINAVLIYNGVNVNSIKQNFYRDNDNYKILQISRLDHTIKGQDILIDAMNILVHHKKINNIRVDFIGEGPSYDYLKTLVAINNLDNHVNFLGIRDRAYIYENLCNYNLLIQPSLYEGFGLTIIEAMIAKIPVLVSNIDGPEEIIENEKYGWHFKCGDAKSCALKIELIMNSDLNIVNNMVTKSYKHASEKFNIIQTANNYIRLYQIENLI